ncbi:hypothetical protein Skr01_56920 [Sphaerisporangium krabiense]|nr:hypothetical protein Skr01_56920 [Sphaerisporangium krabiense]
MTVLPPPEGPWPSTLFSVGLCPKKQTEGTRKCRSGVTDRQRQAVEAAIRGVSGIEKYEFLTAEAALKAMTDDGSGESLLTEEETMPSFEGRFRSVGDEKATRPLTDDLRSAVEHLPGVVSVELSTDRTFWSGKSDLAVRLCGEPPNEDPPCAGRGRPSRQERKAIETALAAVSNIDKVYFEDAGHTRRVAEHLLGEPPALNEVSEAYQIKILDKRAVEAIEQAVQNLPGVDRVVVPQLTS